MKILGLGDMVSLGRVTGKIVGISREGLTIQSPDGKMSVTSLARAEELIFG